MMSPKPNLLWITGAQGMLGLALQKKCIEKKISYVATSHSQAEITDFSQLKQMAQEIKPTHVINCAAYTEVDKAEDFPDRAFAVNVEGVLHLAKLSLEIGFKLVHISTDYVFDGSQNKPYKETDPCSAVNVYGMSKWEGEKAILSVAPEACIIRTSWLFGGKGKNFIDSVLKWLREKESFQAVTDQMSCPTYVEDLSEAILDLLDAQGIVHFANKEGVSRYELALEIQKEMIRLGVEIPCKRIDPVQSASFGMRAKRPSYTVLSTERFTTITGKEPRPWKEAMRSYLHDAAPF